MQSTSFSTWVKSIRVVVGRILRFWDSRNIKKNFEFVGVKPRLMESKIETLTLTLVNLFHLSRKRAVTMTEQVNRLVSPDRGRSKNAALPSTSQVTCSRLDVEGMDLQRTSSRELGNSLQVVIEDLRETATAISEDPPGAKEKPSEGERDKTSRTENTLSEAGEEIAESGEGFPPPSSPWTRDREASLQPVIEETNGVVSMVIPTEVLSDANPLWRCYVVGYFIGDAPHVGSIHATVNRIWANPKNMTKIDNQNVVGKLLQELEDLAVQKSTEVGSSSDRLTEKYGEGARSGDSTDPPLNAEGYEEAFVLNRTEQKQWSLVQTGSTYNKVPSETGEGNSNGITVSPSRFNVLAVSEDEGELDDIEEGELVPVLTKTEVPRETKRRGKAQQSVVNKNSRKKVVNSRDLRLFKYLRRRSSLFVLRYTLLTLKLSLSENREEVRKPFRFFNYLKEHEEFLPTVAKLWESTESLHHSRASLGMFHKKLKALKYEMRLMNKTHYGDLPARTKQAYENQVLRDPNPMTFAAAAVASDRWNKLARIEEKFFRQKSCIRCLAAGDLNTTFFHRSVQSRASWNAIRQLHTESGEILNDPTAISREAVQHFQRFLQSQDHGAADVSITSLRELLTYRCDLHAAAR
ncbi:hypothetical protein HID58_061144, partial [Brassica napus]